MRATLTYLFRPENDVYRPSPRIRLRHPRSRNGSVFAERIWSRPGSDPLLQHDGCDFSPRPCTSPPDSPHGVSRLRIAYSLIAPYMLVETAGIGYTWWTGNHTIFHAIPYTFGTSIELHFWGHVIGGVTWEPLFIFRSDQRLPTGLPRDTHARPEEGHGLNGPQEERRQI